MMRFISLIVPVVALEPFVPPISIPFYQASLPDVIDVSYDVPSKGLTSELAAIKASSTSFLQRGGKTDVFFENPNFAAQEADYQNILKAVEAAIDARFATLSASVARGSFLKVGGVREPSIKIFVDQAAKGKHVDLARLSADALAYAAGRVASLGHNSFLRMSGDPSPKPLPVLNVDVETPAYVSAAEIANLQNEMAGLNALSGH